MACKRTATSDLNHDNWNEDDEPEEAGTFVKAAPEILEKRVVKAARRRLPRTVGDAPTKSAFGSFTGFKSTGTPAASPFSFLAKSNALGNVSTVSGNGIAKIPENGSNEPSEVPQKSSSEEEPKKAEEGVEKDKNIFKKSSDYFAKLKGLNEGVTQWIKSHVDSNPFCILTPIFRDYERYLKEIEANRGNETLKSISSGLPLEPPKATSSVLPEVTESVSAISQKNTETSTEKSSVFDSAIDWGANKSVFGASNTKANSIFGVAPAEKSASAPIFGGNTSHENNPFLSNKVTTSPSSKTTESETLSSGYSSFTANPTTATFSFGQSTTTSTSPPSTGFSFGSGKPFSFGSTVAAPTDSNAETETKEDDEEPPKPDFKPITEDDAFFEKRCKVFIKKDGIFSDRGVGVLFLKSTPNNKTQLIVRADNSLGNLLLNTLLTTSIPTKRMNKNTVMLVCLPLPDSDPPPTPVLLRVKTSEDADTLIETLDNNKK